MWKKYREMWELAEMPRLEDIAGRHKVHLAIAPWWEDEKKIFQEDHPDLYSGINITPDKEWGYFFAHESPVRTQEELRYYGHPSCVILDYDQQRNTKIQRRIVDHIRICDDGIIIGRFHLRVGDGLWFLSWFTMERIDDE